MTLTQALLYVQFEREKKDQNLTSMAGIGVFFDLFKIMRVVQQLNHHLGQCKGEQGVETARSLLPWFRST